MCAPPPHPPGVPEEAAAASGHAQVRKGGAKQLTREERTAYEDFKEDLELVEQYERPELKAVQYGLGATFFEFNELAVQFG